MGQPAKKRKQDLQLESPEATTLPPPAKAKAGLPGWEGTLNPQSLAKFFDKNTYAKHASEDAKLSSMERTGTVASLQVDSQTQPEAASDATTPSKETTATSSELANTSPGEPDSASGTPSPTARASADAESTAGEKQTNSAERQATYKSGPPTANGGIVQSLFI